MMMNVIDEVKKRFRDEKSMQTIVVQNKFYKLWKEEVDE